MEDMILCIVNQRRRDGSSCHSFTWKWGRLP